MKFNEEKHGYVLSFPWNYPEIINKHEAAFRPMAKNSYWDHWLTHTNAKHEFSKSFREFH